ADVVVPDSVQAEISVLKGIAATYVMAPREDDPVYQRQRLILTDLVAVLYDRAEVALAEMYAEDFGRAGDDDIRLRVVVDQVASLTDLSALEWHSSMCGPDVCTSIERLLADASCLASPRQRLPGRRYSAGPQAVSKG